MPFLISAAIYSYPGIRQVALIPTTYLFEDQKNESIVRFVGDQSKTSLIDLFFQTYALIRASARDTGHKASTSSASFPSGSRII